MKPRVVVQRLDNQQFAAGKYGWTNDMQKARVYRSEGTARKPNWVATRVIPVHLQPIIADGQ